MCPYIIRHVIACIKRIKRCPFSVLKKTNFITKLKTYPGYGISDSLEPQPPLVVFVCRISNEIGQYGKRLLVCLPILFPMDFERVFFYFYYINRPEWRTEHAALVYGYGREQFSASVHTYIHLEREKKGEVRERTRGNGSFSVSRLRSTPPPPPPPFPFARAGEAETATCVI